MKRRAAGLISIHVARSLGVKRSPGSIRASRVEFGALAVFAGRLIEFTSGQGGARPRVLPKDNAVMTGEKVKLRESLRQSHRVPYRIANHE